MTTPFNVKVGSISNTLSQDLPGLDVYEQTAYLSPYDISTLSTTFWGELVTLLAPYTLKQR